ncbi:hypothetical protein [Stutzerimonas chloritidismutans]
MTLNSNTKIDPNAWQEALQQAVPPVGLRANQHHRRMGQQHHQDRQPTEKLNIAILAVPRSGITHKQSDIRKPPRLPAIAWVIQDRFHYLGALFNTWPASRCALASTMTSRYRRRSILARLTTCSHRRRRPL